MPTHIGFIDGLVPGADGQFFREADGRIAIVAEMMTDLKELGLDVHLIMMLGGANPMNPADEHAGVAQLVPSLKAAIERCVVSVASTSIKEWMNGLRNFSPHLPSSKTRSAQPVAGFLCPEIHDLEFAQHNEIRAVLTITTSSRRPERDMPGQRRGAGRGGHLRVRVRS